MIIDYTFFQSGELRISGLPLPGVTAGPTNNAVLYDLSSYIARYEDEYLEFALGEMYDPFCEYLRSGGSGEEKWDTLKGKLVIELKEGEFTMKRSPIANYVYFHYLRDHQSDATATGVKKDTDEGTLVSPELKMVCAWNDMVSMNDALFRWIDSNRNEYPEWSYEVFLLSKINIFGL